MELNDSLLIPFCLPILYFIQGHFCRSNFLTSVFFFFLISVIMPFPSARGIAVIKKLVAVYVL